MVINYHRDFFKTSKKLTFAQKRKSLERLRVFGENQFDPALNNHALTGKYKGYRSINITGDLRALYREEGGDKVTFVKVDTYSNLYG